MSEWFCADCGQPSSMYGHQGNCPTVLAPKPRPTVDYCRNCGVSPVVEGLPGVWRFEGRDGLVYRFRLWQVDIDLSEFLFRRVAHPTTQTYQVSAIRFWRAPTPTLAAAPLAAVLDGCVDEPVWQQFTCNEADALAAALASLGLEATSRRMLAAHARGDEDGDSHVGFELEEATA